MHVDGYTTTGTAFEGETNIVVMHNLLCLFKVICIQFSSKSMGFGRHPKPGQSIITKHIQLHTWVIGCPIYGSYWVKCQCHN